MATSTPSITRTAHLLDLMKQGDDAFNNRDFAAMDAIHHPDMIAHVTGSAEPIYGRAAHAEAMKQMFAMFPDVHVDNDPYPIQIGQGDWTTVITRATGTFTGEMTPTRRQRHSTDRKSVRPRTSPPQPGGRQTR